MKTLPHGIRTLTLTFAALALQLSIIHEATAAVWVTNAPMSTARVSHTATLLPNGKLLVVGGFNAGVYLSSAELYDPATGLWTATGSLSTGRVSHTATLLPNGKVLVVGGTTTGTSPLSGAGSGLVSTNWPDPNAVTNSCRFYRVQLTP